MTTRKTSSKRSVASRPMNKKAMKRTKGGSAITAAPSAIKVGMCDGSVTPIVGKPVNFEL